MEQLEIRSSGAIRATAGRLEGYAAVFNAEAHLGGFVEVIRAGAFQKSLAAGQNIQALYHHQDNALLGATRSGTLQLAEDHHGLKFSLALPDTSYGKDVGVLVARGDIAGCSFGFRVRDGGDRWEERNGGEWLRELLDVELREITVTGDPAYQDTSVALRSLGQVEGDRSFDDAIRNPIILWMQTC
ncbi:HK97 family phage prohead protease [Eoetvoesiella caeni]